MPAGLIEALQQLHALFPRAEVTPHELLDLLWLADRLDRPADAAPAEPQTLPEVKKPLPPEPRGSVKSRASELPPKERPRAEPPSPAPAVVREGELHVDTGRAAEEKGEKKKPAVPLKVGGPPGLPEANRVGRALRPLMKRVPSRLAMVLDETATAELTAEARLFHEVKRPSSARWLDLGIVIDRSGAMDIWDKPVAELRDLLERHRAFRNVRAWDMWDDSGQLRFRTWSREPRTMSASELSDPTGAQLIIVVSDCVSRAWLDDQIPQFFQLWSNHGPVALIQVMPPELWRRTALRYARPTLVRATAPGVANRYVHDISDTYDEDLARDTVVVPVTSLEAVALSQWANFVAATGGASAQAYAFRTTLSDEERDAFGERMAQAKLATAEERVRRFDLTATADARSLARVLAAAPFPLTPPVLRLVQDRVLPNTPRSAMAEVILGGLMRSQPARDGNPEHTAYEFVSEEVRERLLDRARASDMRRLLYTEVSKFEGQAVANVVDFSVLLTTPTALGSLKIAVGEIPFARIGVNVLKRLGGEFATLAADIDKILSATAVVDGAPDAGNVRVDTNTLQAYLEAPLDITEPDPLYAWIRGLRRFGVVVMLEAMLIGADQTRSGRRARTGILAKAREILEGESRDQALELASALAGSWDLSKADAATLAAQAVVVTFRWLARTGPIAEAAVLTAMEAIVEETSNVGALYDAIRKRLLADVVARTIQTHGPLPFRGRIIVAGTVLDKGLPDLEQRTALQVGRKLARNGFELAVGGWPGVDYLVTSAFVRELELRSGEDVDARLFQRVQHGDPPPDFKDVRTMVVDSWADSIIDQARAVVVIGPCNISMLERHAAHRKVPVLATKWTHPTVGQPGPRAGRYLDETDVTSPQDVELMTDRVLAAVTTLGDGEARERWRNYTNLLYSIVGEQRPLSVLEQKAPRLARFIEGLAADRSALPPLSPDTASEQLDGLGSDLGEWLIFDILTLSEVEPDWFEERNFLLRRLTEVAKRIAPTMLRVWLERRWRGVGKLLPPRPIEGLMPIARVLFADDLEFFSAWSHGIAGLSPEECEFRMSIPFEVFRAARRYSERATGEADPELEVLLYGLLRRDAPYEFVSRYAESDDAGARLIAYILMQTNVYTVAATELARRLDDEVRRASDTADARALKQLLLAVSTMSANMDLPSRRIVARALVHVSAQLAGSRAYEARRCHDHIEALLRLAQFRDAHAGNVTVDRYAGSRTRMLWSTPIALRKIDFRGDEIEYLFRTGSAQQRLMALKLAALASDASSFEVVHAALTTPLSDAELRSALQAAEVMSPRLAYSQLAILEQVVEAASARSPSDVRRAALAVGRGLRARLETVDRMRHVPIAVIGSDPSGGLLRDFCRRLGEQLAARDLGLVVANPDLGGWLMEGYRSRRPDLHGFVMMRRESDRRPLRDGVPYRIVEGDLTMLREQMLGLVRGAIVVGGRKGTYEEYAIARRRGIPVVAVAASGSSAAGVAKAAAKRLYDDGVSRQLLDLLTRREMSPSLPSIAVETLAWAIGADEMRRQQQSGELQRLAMLGREELAAEVLERVGDKHAKRVDKALKLLAMADEPSRWTRTEEYLIKWRGTEKEVQRLAFIDPADPVIGELVSRCALAMCVLEAAVLAKGEEEERLIQRAGAPERFAAAGADVLEGLARIIRGRGPATPHTVGRRAALLARLDQEIETLRKIG